MVLVLLVAMTIAAIATAGAASVRVPDLRGLTRSAISAKLTAAHLRLAVRSAYSSGPRGTAIVQAPIAGVRASEGSRVIVTLSAGPAPVVVPRVIGFSQGDAASSLHQLGLHPAMQEVAAPGVTPGTVTAEKPTAGRKLLPGSIVSLSVAEPPRWREVITFSDQSGEASPAFRIRGTQWRIVYRMAYSGTCTFIFFCSGPTAHVSDLARPTTVSSFDLNDGSGQIRTFGTGPGMYELRVTPGDDSATWSARVQDYY